MIWDVLDWAWYKLDYWNNIDYRDEKVIIWTILNSRKDKRKPIDEEYEVIDFIYWLIEDE